MAKNDFKIDNGDVLRWRFDVNTFRLLGRELITDRITAIFELVKNCYDANAEKVTVDLFNASSNLVGRKISITDDGIGMSFEDIRDKWMVVGTNSKRTSLYSAQPFNRKFVGEKGIGRFAVDKLGERLLIRTKQVGEKQWLNVNINWDDYEQKISNTKPNQLLLFTDVDNKYFYEDCDINDHGTKLIITQIRENWTNSDLIRLYKELSKLVSPFYPLSPPFDIYLNSNEWKDYSNKIVKPDPLKFYSHFAELEYDIENNKQEKLSFDKKNGKIIKEWVDVLVFGPIKMKLFYFNENAKRKYTTAYKSDDTRIDGIKIYRDGIITTPFAEYEAERDKKRDILGIDKRRWTGAFDKVSTREIIGVVDITKQDNPGIIDSTNRQDFLANEEYQKLKEFILEQIDVFGDVKKYERNFHRSIVEKELQKAGKEVKNFSNTLSKIEKELEKEKPQLKDALAPLKKQAVALNSIITQSISEQKKFQNDVTRKEKIYLSLMSLQEYASNISHAIRTSLGKIKRMAEFLSINFPNEKFDSLFKQYALLINEEMGTLLKVTDFMLSYASADIDFEDFSVKELIEKLLLSTYKETFNAEKIQAIVEIKDDFIINANKKFIEDIFQNFISNSVKALRNTENKKIKCTGFLDDDSFTLYFSDNGCGVKKGDEKWIFGLFNTRTADQGGAGIGLYIVEKRIEALKGLVELVDSEYKPSGATFKIQLPFNKD